MVDKLISNPTTAGCLSLAPPPPWIDLPTDVTANILLRLGVVEILESAQKVCATWWRVCKDPSMWRVIDMKNSGDSDPQYLESMCLDAVDRSQGELIDINIEYFGHYDMLFYMSDRSPRLKRVRVAFGDCFSGRDLTAVVKKLPELEELHVFHTPAIYAADIETISRCCPMLKLITLNDCCFRFPFFEIVDGYALVVAENMLNLRQLQFVESIKDLRHFYDSTADYDQSDDEEFYYDFY